MRRVGSRTWAWRSIDRDGARDHWQAVGGADGGQRAVGAVNVATSTSALAAAPAGSEKANVAAKAPPERPAIAPARAIRPPSVTWTIERPRISEQGRGATPAEHTERAGGRSQPGKWRDGTASGRVKRKSVPVGSDARSFLRWSPCRSSVDSGEGIHRYLPEHSSILEGRTRRAGRWARGRGVR